MRSFGMQGDRRPVLTVVPTLPKGDEQGQDNVGAERDRQATSFDQVRHPTTEASEFLRSLLAHPSLGDTAELLVAELISNAERGRSPSGRRAPARRRTRVGTSNGGTVLPFPKAVSAGQDTSEAANL